MRADAEASTNKVCSRVRLGSAFAASAVAACWVVIGGGVAFANPTLPVAVPGGPGLTITNVEPGHTGLSPAGGNQSAMGLASSAPLGPVLTPFVNVPIIPAVVLPLVTKVVVAAPASVQQIVQPVLTVVQPVVKVVHSAVSQTKAVVAGVSSVVTGLAPPVKPAARTTSVTTAAANAVPARRPALSAARPGSSTATVRASALATPVNACGVVADSSTSTCVASTRLAASGLRDPSSPRTGGSLGGSPAATTNAIASLGSKIASLLGELLGAVPGAGLLAHTGAAIQILIGFALGMLLVGVCLRTANACRRLTIGF